jgi:amino-acid N-acetyltransferase
MSTPAHGGGPPVLVREATPADLPAARRLIGAAGLPLGGLDDADLLIAEAGDRVIGTVALERHGTGADGAVLLRSAAVDPSWRGCGIGTELVRAALEQTTGAPTALLTETAADYFVRFGFRPVDRAELPGALSASAELTGACPTSAQAMLRASN